MDPYEDREFFYIAREGLKAPLPDPWKPIQSRDDEIFYMNLETGETSWDHPCDKYYKEMFLKEKEKKRRKGGAQVPQPSAGGKTRKKGLLDQAREFSQNINMGASNSFGGSGLYGGMKNDSQVLDIPKNNLFNKSDDPLLKAQQEKKQKEYREKKQKEFDMKKKEIDQQYEKKLEDLRQQHR